MILPALLLASSCHGFQLSTSNMSPCAAFHARAMPTLRRQARTSMDDAAAWKPRRKPYIPSWTRGGSNVYRDQQSEYNEYAKQIESASGAGCSGEDATRDSEPLVASNDQAATQGASARLAASLVAAWGNEIEQACAPVHYLCVSDVTDGHAVEGAKDGRAARADGRDLKVLIVSDRFSRESGPARQQVVNAVLYNYIKSGALHSVSMRCWTPAEWEAKGSPVDLGAPCFYVSTGNNLPHDVECGPSLPLPGCTTAPPDVLPPDVA